MLTTSQAYTIIVMRLGQTKGFAYDDFAVWWATGGKLKFVKAVFRLFGKESSKLRDLSDVDSPGIQNPNPPDVRDSFEEFPEDIPGGNPGGGEGSGTPGSPIEGGQNIEDLVSVTIGNVGVPGLSVEILFTMLLGVVHEEYYDFYSGTVREYSSDSKYF